MILPELLDRLCLQREPAPPGGRLKPCPVPAGSSKAQQIPTTWTSRSIRSFSLKPPPVRSPRAPVIWKWSLGSPSCSHPISKAPHNLLAKGHAQSSTSPSNRDLSLLQHGSLRQSRSPKTPRTKSIANPRSRRLTTICLVFVDEKPDPTRARPGGPRPSATGRVADIY